MGGAKESRAPVHSKNGWVKNNPIGNPALGKYWTEHVHTCTEHTLTQHAGLFRKPKLESFLPFVGLHFYDSGLYLLGYSHNFTFA